MDLNLKDSVSVKEFSEIAYHCLHDDQEGRPSMDYVLQKLEKALELAELEEAYELQELEEACEWQKLEEALALQELVETLQGQEFVEALALQELEEALELQKLVETLEVHKLGEILELQTDYAAIKAIHMMTSTPPTYSTKEEIYTYLSTGILVDEGKVWFSIDENGRSQEMISAIMFVHQDPSKCETVSDPGSRFGKVAKILDASKVNIQVKIRTQFLSPKVTYAAYLICKHEGQFFGRPIIRSIKYKLNNQSQSYTSYLGDYNDNGWMMIQLFQTRSMKKNVEIKILVEEFHLAENWGHDEVIVEGIVFLPIHKLDDENIIMQEVENPPLFDIECENRLPSDYKQFIYYLGKSMKKKSHNYDITETPEEAYSILSKGIYIKVENDINVWFWITKSDGKKCIRLAPVSIQASPSGRLHHRPPNETRFRYVLNISSSPGLLVSFKIKSPLLSTKTTYACYLVYKIQQDLENPVIVVIQQRELQSTHGENNLGNDHRMYNQEKIVYLSTPQSPVIGPHCEKKSSTTAMNKPKYIEFPEKRKDGWWDVRLGEFITVDEQLVQDFQPRICTRIPWFTYMSNHANDENDANGEVDDAMTKFATLCPDHEPVIDVYMIWQNQENKYVKIPNLIVQGIEFRPL